MTANKRPARSDDELMQGIVEAYHEVFDTFYNQPSKLWLELKLTLPQWKTLVLIALQKSTTVGYLACRMSIGEPTASHLVDKLVLAGFVAREEDPEDRRRMRVSVSRQGRELLDNLIRPQRDVLRDAVGLLSERDKRDLLRILGTIGSSLADRRHQE